MSTRRPQELAAQLRDHRGLTARWLCTPDCLITGIPDEGCHPTLDGLIVLEAADLIEAQLEEIRRLTSAVDRAELFSIEAGHPAITRTGEIGQPLDVNA